MKALRFFALFLGVGTLHAQTPGVDCVPVQGQGWQGCAPLDNGVQQPQRSQPPPQMWMDHYGAIATDEPRGAMGASTDMQDRQSAEDVAMANCQAKGGVNCRVQISYGNQCVALVVGGKIFNVNSGATISQATEKGMQMCKPEANDCHVYYSACSRPQRIK